MAPPEAITCQELAVGPEPHPFTWKEIELEPKAWKCCLARAHRTTEYEVLHTGGFLRLCTERGRVYWMAQNEHDHRTPDWKIHFSVCPDDVPRAWDLLSQLFIDRACDFGMKAVAGEALAEWPAKQRGRELTVYIFQHSSAYGRGGPMMGLCPEGSEHRFWLGPEFERDSDFWLSWVRDAEAVLSEAGIRSNGGIADGDLPLGGRYASLRNEAFVLGREPASTAEGYIYPPNEAGWNAARQPCPIELPARARWYAKASGAISTLRCGCAARRPRRGR